MSLLDDTSVDRQVRAALESLDDDDATTENLIAAAAIAYAPTTTLLEETARWLAVVERLELTTTQITRAMLRATVRAYEVHGPDVSLLAKLLADDPAGLALAREMADELVLRTRTAPMQTIANAALARLALDHAIEPHHDALFAWFPSSPPLTRSIFASLPMDRREALALSLTRPLVGENVNIARGAAHLLNQLVQIGDLVVTPAVLAHREILRQLAGDVPHATSFTLEAPPTAAAQRALAVVLAARRPPDV